MFKKAVQKPVERSEYTYFRGLFPKGVSVITLVIMAVVNGNLVPRHLFRVSNSHLDFAELLKLFPVKDGKPVIGPMVFRQRTKKEMQSDELGKGKGLYLPVGNVGNLFSLLMPDVAKAA